ncbi:Carboxypeptidase regulatory-like domain-containing protein [Flavimobilis marinus]|uniref:Carboxypeptidase regulatory-like domain-containing protein n=1 Tax=Flavimobilis marinus TaxID=285351 RepID=A0A1I2CLA6_9MICO|nr:carboxypeptidase regulatory-like domain-containing protein [Flavimobilis marinus]SFE68942.1 Carboxypeptidase regulatory-like domain-containing protein [Flavimobilis marinus]
MVRRLTAALISAILVLTGMTVVGTSAQAAPPATASVAVRVLTQRDQVVTQSLIRLEHPNGAFAGIELVDDDGWTRFTDLAPGRYRAKLDVPLGKASERSVELDLAAGEAATQTIRITADQTLSGQITVAGAPWAGADVVAYKFSGSTAKAPRNLTARADQDGRYTLVLPEGVFTVVAGTRSWDGPALGTFAGGVVRVQDAERTTLTAGSHATLDVAAIPGVTITGRLVDAQGRPQSGVFVQATPLGRAGDARAWSQTDGSFVLTGATAGRHLLSFSSASGGDYVTTVTTASVAAGRTVKLGKVTLKRPAGWGTSSLVVRLTGAVREAPGTVVYLKNSRGRIVGQQEFGDLEDGPPHEVAFRNIAPGRYRAVVAQTGQSTAVSVARGKAATARIRVKAPKKTGSALIRVVRPSSGKPVEGASVELCAKVCYRAAWTDSRGRARVAKVPVGKYKVKVAGVSTSTTTSQASTAPVKITVKRGKTTTKTLRLPLDGKVKGKVVGREDVRVRLVPVGSGPVLEWQWVKKGSFVVRNVPAGRYRMVVRDATTGGALDLYYKGSTLKSSKIIKVKPGRTLDLGKFVFRG